ncbi:MAG: histidine phosphatase family protein [Burkholderiaceae bacterium]
MAVRNIHALFQAFLAQKAHGYCVVAFLFALFSLTAALPAAATELTGQALFDRVKQGGVALLMRHAQTVPGTGDPPNFKLSDCATQRNLSEEGKEQSRRIGAALRDAGVAPTAVRSSAWCRCKDTAKLAFGDYRVWSQLNSFFDARTNEPTQTAELVRALQLMKPNQIEVWITHQVNITALTGLNPAMGEIYVLRFGGRQVEVIGRMRL